ncbi:MAG: hypothetical protein L0I29_09260 [Hyphomicrobiales bacterium]|nr:hypothetical protein [Hyphomicrobiales bacterium]
MSLRLPGQNSLTAPGQTGVDVLDYELRAEKAASLGRAGYYAERHLDLLRTYQGDAEGRALLLRKTTEAVYAWFIQRELCGLRRHESLIREYAIPGEVLARLGAR